MECDVSDCLCDLRGARCLRGHGKEGEREEGEGGDELHFILLGTWAGGGDDVLWHLI